MSFVVLRTDIVPSGCSVLTFDRNQLHGCLLAAFRCMLAHFCGQRIQRLIGKEILLPFRIVEIVTVQDVNEPLRLDGTNRVEQRVQAFRRQFVFRHFHLCSP